MINPLFPNIIIERIKPEEKQGGIILPKSDKESCRGLVLYVYEGCDVEGGQIVIYKRYAGEPIEIEGKDCLILDAMEVLAIYER